MSSPPVSELVFLEIGPKCTPEEFLKFAKTVRGQPGCNAVYWGPTLDDETVIYMFIREYL